MKTEVNKPVVKNRKRFRKRYSLNRTAYLFILPALVGMLFVHFIPMIWGVTISFLDLDIYTIANWLKAPFIGLENYLEGFSGVTTIGQRFLVSLWNVTVYSVLTISIGYVIALGAVKERLDTVWHCPTPSCV